MMGYVDPQYDLLVCLQIGESFKFMALLMRNMTYHTL